MPVSLGLLSSTENRTTVLFQPRPRRARLLVAGGDWRPLRAPAGKMCFGDGRWQLRLYLRRAGDNGALSAAHHFDCDLKRDLRLDQGRTKIRLRRALLRSGL